MWDAASGKRRNFFASFVSDTLAAGYACRCGGRCRCDSDCGFNGRMYRNRRWCCTSGKRNFSGILAESGIIFDSAVFCGMCGIVFAGGKKKGEKVPFAIFALCGSGISDTAIMKTKEGSLTVEAAIIFPIVLALFTLTMQTGIELYQESRETAALIMEEGKTDTVKLFYRYKILGEWMANED